MKKTSMAGKISGTVIAILALIAVIAVLGMSYVAGHNRGNSYEAELRKADEGRKTTLSSCTVDIRNISKLPTEYFNQLKELVDAEMEGRYGGQGTERVAKFISERAVGFDNSMLQKVQNRISACEIQFKNAQDRMVDVREDFQKALGTFWGGSFMRMAGYPKLDLDKFKILMDSSSATQFETGTREDYDLNLKK